MTRAVARFHHTLVGLINDRRLIEVALAGSSELGKISSLLDLVDVFNDRDLRKLIPKRK